MVVVGGQFGSEGKGAVTGMLAKQAEEYDEHLTVVRVAGPNAGHSAVDDQGRKWALRQIPVAAVTARSARLVIGAGSEIDQIVLAQEIEALDAAGFDVSSRLWIDSQATLITEENRRAEGGNDGPLQSRIGSTGKGIGAARADRIWRKAPLWGSTINAPHGPTQRGGDTGEQLRRWMTQEIESTVIIEGTQGYGLGLHAGHYPYCTSSDCRAIDFLAMAGISPWTHLNVSGQAAHLEVWVVLRTFPIRVAGNSGPLHDEIDWAILGEETGGYVQEERTTVTKKVRRVGRWDRQLAAAAVQANGGYPTVKVALTFADYWWPSLAGATEKNEMHIDQMKKISEIEHEIDTPIDWIGTGPDTGVWLR